MEAERERFINGSSLLISAFCPSQSEQLQHWGTFSHAVYALAQAWEWESQRLQPEHFKNMSPNKAFSLGSSFQVFVTTEMPTCIPMLSRIHRLLTTLGLILGCLLSQRLTWLCFSRDLEIAGFGSSGPLPGIVSTDPILCHWNTSFQFSTLYSHTFISKTMSLFVLTLHFGIQNLCGQMSRFQ